MKRQLWIAMISLALALFGVSQIACTNTQDDQSATTNSNMAPPEAAPDTAAIEKELLRIENDWPRVMKERDGQAVRRINADDVYLLGWDGSTATKEEDAKFIESGNLSADAIEMSDLKVRVLDKDAAVVTGMITVRGAKYEAPNKCLEVNGSYRFVDTFARRDGEWKLVASSAVKVMNPGSPTPSPTTKASPAPTASPAAKAIPRPSPVVRSSPLVRPSPAVRPSPVRVVPAPSPATTPQ